MQLRCELLIPLSDPKSALYRYGTPTYKPIVWLERPVPLYERIALYSIADVAVVTATRDGMNLVPYEYIVCRQGADVSAAMCCVNAALFYPAAAARLTCTVASAHAAFTNSAMHVRQPAVSWKMWQTKVICTSSS